MSQKAKKYTVKFSGESGQGVNSAGEIFAGALKNAGYQTFGYREYPSLIEGGNASYQVDFSKETVYWPSQNTDILVAISRYSIYEYLDSLKPNSVILHSLANLRFNKAQEEVIKNNNLEVVYINAEEIAIESGADKRIVNVLMLAVVWHNLGLPVNSLTDELKQQYSSKEALLKLDLEIVSEVKNIEIKPIQNLFILDQPIVESKKGYQISGNHALALGAINAGLRAIYAYPMTPATSIFKYIAETADKTRIITKQTEDEISAAQMTLGSMYMGTRAMTATSGGGFDLMTESISMAGGAEIPIVVVLAQRAGPSTGIPTWNGAGDLNVALYGGHGDFPRCVVSVSDAKSAYIITQKAFNIAEEFQLPVIILTEKNIAESLYQIDGLTEKTAINRGLTTEEVNNLFESTDRYKNTESGVSPRWLPGSSEVTYKTNSDEHFADGKSTEAAQTATDMNDKRLKKMLTLEDVLPEPEIFGNKELDNVVVGWGSTKGLVQEYLKSNNDLLYIHYEWILPFKADLLLEQIKSGKKVSFIENNSTGQLAALALQNITELKVYKTLYKYDGRPIYLEELDNFVKSL